MNVLVLGATGFIGSAVAAKLLGEGHEVTAVVRAMNATAARIAATRFIERDLRTITGWEDWRPLLAGVDAVVNCAGVLQDSPRDSTSGVHATAVAALFEACERAGIRRVVHVSAMGVDRETPTAFSRSKREGDEALMARDLDWVILRPSVVVGRPAYGGSALFRGLAALPLVPAVQESGPLQIVQLDDVVAAAVYFLRSDAPARVAVELAGPERLEVREVIARYRRWLGWGSPRFLPLPGWAAAAMYRLGDLVSLLGWRPPIRSNAQRELVRGAIGDPQPWIQLSGRQPQSLLGALSAEPVSVQERWFAQLYFLKPLVFGVLALFWITTGVVSLGPGWDIGVGLLRDAGLGWLAAPSVVAGALADIAVGVAIAIQRTARWGLYAAIAVSLFYAVAGTVLTPQLWADPLGPMLKIWPILVLILVALAIREDR